MKFFFISLLLFSTVQASKDIIKKRVYSILKTSNELNLKLYEEGDTSFDRDIVIGIRGDLKHLSVLMLVYEDFKDLKEMRMISKWKSKLCKHINVSLELNLTDKKRSTRSATRFLTMEFRYLLQKANEEYCIS